MVIPKFMKLMRCSCGHKLYSIDAKPSECPYCYKTVYMRCYTQIMRDTVKERTNMLINTLNRSLRKE